MSGPAKPEGLLLSGYDADSHRYWRHQVAEMTANISWRQLSLAPRHFAWRAAGAPLSWRDQPELTRRYDVVLATSVVDVNRLVGLNPQLTSAHVVVYFHDNQFAYPRQSGQQGLTEIQLASIYSALTADRLIFNSEYNKQTFLSGAASLLKRLPQDAPDLTPALEAKAKVLPVALAPPPRSSSRVRIDAGEPLKIVWNHRWEYDKGPDRLLAIVELLEQQQLNYQLSLLGRQFRQVPKPLQQIQSLFPHRVAHAGYVPDKLDYWRHLAGQDVVLSTALHEFQGLAAQEAVLAGCVPVLPARLAYPEWAGSRFLYDSNLDEIGAEAQSAVARISELARLKRDGHGLPQPDLSAYMQTTLAADYQQALIRAPN